MSLIFWLTKSNCSWLKVTPVTLSPAFPIFSHKASYVPATVKKDIENKKDSTEIKNNKQKTDSVKSPQKKSPKVDKKTEKEQKTVVPKDSTKNKNNRPIG